MCDDVGEISDGKVRFEWKIEKMPCLLEAGNNADLLSPIFEYDGTIWYLGIRPSNSTLDEGKRLELFILRTDDWKSESVGVMLGFCREDGSEEKVCEGRASFKEDVNTWGPIGLLDETQLQEALGQSSTLSIFCYLKREEYEDENSDESSDESTDDEEEKVILDQKSCANFRYHMKKLLSTEEDYDVTLSVKGHHFHAHRSVLRARSPVLYGMLKDPGDEEVLELVDCDPLAFQIFLKFLYSGEVDNLTSDNVSCVCCTANRYGEQRLKHLCFEFLKKSLSADTVCDTIVLASKCGDEGLLNKAAKFFVAHRDEIMDREDWIHFLGENPLLGNDLFKRIARVVKNEIRWNKSSKKIRNMEKSRTLSDSALSRPNAFVVGRVE